MNLEDINTIQEADNSLLNYSFEIYDQIAHTKDENIILDGLKEYQKISNYLVEKWGIDSSIHDDFVKDAVDPLIYLRMNRD